MPTNKIKNRNLILDGPTFQSGLFNFKNPDSSQFSKWKQTVARVNSGTGRGRIVVCGDSTSWGEGGGTGGSNNRTGAKQLCWPTIVGKTLVSLGIPANWENIAASGSNSGVVVITDYTGSTATYKTGLVPGSSWGLSSSTTAGGCLFTDTTGTTNFAYTPEIPVDTFELYDIQVSTGGAITYQVDSGTTTPLSQANTTSFYRTTTIPAGSVGTHTLNIARTSGNAFIAGVRAYNSTVPAIDVINLGRGSSQTSDWIVNANPWSPLPALQAYCTTADLVIIDHTINDALNAQTIANYKANMQTLINTAKVGGADVMLMTGNPSNTSTISDQTQETFNNAIKDVAIANGLPLIDQRAKYGSWFNLNQRGFMYNANHPNQYGYNDIGIFVGNILKKYSV